MCEIKTLLIKFTPLDEIAYFDTVTNDPTLMEISVAAQQVPSLQNAQNVDLSQTTESEKTLSTLKEKCSNNELEFSIT